MTVQAAKQGYAFATVRPRGERNFEARTINIAFVVEEGARAYIERINVRGNTRTRDYVIRREFDLGEGDAYNRALVDRAERRLKNLGFFKTVRITNEPGSAPDRVVINVDVEEQATGEFSVSGGYSTADGFIAEVSVVDRNLMGRGNYGKASLTYGQRTRGFDLPPEFGIAIRFL
jgi:outer membrane protein insertion porin family